MLTPLRHVHYSEAVMQRRKTRQIQLGTVKIGGDAPITVQSMTKTDTRNVDATLDQIWSLEAAGCDIVRLAVPVREAAEKLGEIKKQIRIPLIADIHFNYKLALIALQQGVDGLRLNPGNIGERWCVEEVIKKTLPEHLLTKETKFLINPTGRFVVGGPQGDTGLTGRKIIVDSYGGMGRHGGGAFSGKDPSKVDRSAAYMGRYVAKNIVAAGLATSTEIQFAYAIGYPDPVSVCVNTFGTGVVSDEEIERAVCEVFSFKPAAIIKQLNLLRPIYSKTTNYGHFGKSDPDITWEKPDKVDALKKALGKATVVASSTLKKAAALADGRSGARSAVHPQVTA